MLVILLTIASLFSQMTDQETKETGVSKLSAKEKKALQVWFNKKNTTQNNNTKKNPSLSENLNGGHYIRLTDNSLWEINPPDVPITQGWITPVEITVGPSGDINYPFILTNTLTGSSVTARKAQALPGAPAGPTGPTGPTGPVGTTGPKMKGPTGTTGPKK